MKPLFARFLLVADTRKITAHNRIRSCALAAAVLLLPALAYAQNQNGQGNNQTAALQAQITALQTQVKTLQTQLNAVLSSNVYKLNNYVSVDFKTKDGVIGPNIVTGANIHILSGSGSTSDGSSRTGRGNLIIGYNEPNGLNPGDRGGSHNLVIGQFHKFTSEAWGGLVAGETNTIAFGEASILGGQFSVASGFASTICGGNGNRATVADATVVCGANNISSGNQCVVLGGIGNTTAGSNAVVLGGEIVTNNGVNSILPQPPFP